MVQCLPSICKALGTIPALESKINLDNVTSGKKEECDPRKVQRSLQSVLFPKRTKYLFEANAVNL